MATALPTVLRYPKLLPSGRLSTFFSDRKLRPLLHSLGEIQCGDTKWSGWPHRLPEAHSRVPIRTRKRHDIDEGFDMMKAAYTRRRKDAAERRGDEEYVAKLERAYDKIMMSQLQKRKQGFTF